MAPIFYRDAQAALVTFDVTSHYSFDRAQWWVDELKQKGPKDVTIILVPILHPHQKERCHGEVKLFLRSGGPWQVGNKVDIVHGRVVSAGKAEAYLAQHPELLFYAETSGITNTLDVRMDLG
jgi:GTPase SAR1 family protein